MSRMIPEVAILDFKQGLGSPFESAFKTAAGIISQMHGYRSHDLQRCIEQPPHCSDWLPFFLGLLRWRPPQKVHRSPGYVLVSAKCYGRVLPATEAFVGRLTLNAKTPAIPNPKSTKDGGSGTKVNDSSLPDSCVPSEKLTKYWKCSAS